MRKKINKRNECEHNTKYLTISVFAPQKFQILCKTELE